MQQETERHLIRQALSGSQSAFRDLVTQHQTFAWSLANRLLNNADDAEDVVQEAFIRTWKHLARYKEEYRFSTWLARIVTNLCLDLLKSKKRKRIVPGMDEGRLEAVAETRSHEQELESSELFRIIQDLSGHLTDLQRSVFVLRDLELLPAEEVCSILGMTPNNMKSNLYYARLNIREGVTKYYKQKESQIKLNAAQL